MFVTVLCTIDEILCVSNTDNKASVVLMLPEMKWKVFIYFFFIFLGVNEFSFGEKSRREQKVIRHGLKM